MENFFQSVKDFVRFYNIIDFPLKSVNWKVTSTDIILHLLCASYIANPIHHPLGLFPTPIWSDPFCLSITGDIMGVLLQTGIIVEVTSMSYLIHQQNVLRMASTSNFSLTVWPIFCFLACLVYLFKVTAFLDFELKAIGSSPNYPTELIALVVHFTTHCYHICNTLDIYSSRSCDGM